MTCDQRQESIGLSVLGALDADEEQNLRAHLATGCPQCIGVTAEAEAVVSRMALAVPPVNASRRVREQLLQRVRADRVQSPTLPKQPLEPEWHRSSDSVSRWVTAIALLFAVAIGASTTHWHMSRALQSQKEEVAWLRDSVNRRKMLNSLMQGDLETANTMLAAVEVRDLRLVTLQSLKTQPDSAWGRILWDTQQQRWYFRAIGMEPAAESRTYALWAVTADDEKIAAGTFDVDAEGRATVVFELPADVGDISLAAVTDEPIGGSPQPTGRFQLSGEIL